MVNENILHIGKNRELFWDDYLVDSSCSTAFPRLMQPVKKETCFQFDQGMELEQVSYPCIVKDESGYKMYYLPWEMYKDGSVNSYLAVIESQDGIHWTRPDLNIFDHPELRENNVVIDHLMDGVFVFKDTNPSCDPSERYKALTPLESEGDRIGGLWCYTSADGYHFKLSHQLTAVGFFDSLNVAFWENGRYYCYLRNYHNIPGGTWKDGIEDYNTRREMIKWENVNAGIRDIRVMYSEDFRNWTVPELIQFDDGMDFPLYTNNVIAYPRAPHVKIGFPVRYVERKKWTPNCSQIGSAALKQKVMDGGNPHSHREGLAVTDAIFMFSRDGETWHRYNEAFFTPGYETEQNWVYGDCYSAYNLIDSGRESYYMYDKGWHRSVGQPKPLYRFEIRKDGFACWMADGQERVLVTKPLVFEGAELHLNFQTSAAGHIYVDVLDENGEALPGAASFELFGDTIDRNVYFEDGGSFAKYAGRPVRLRFRMLDAKLFSMCFE